MIIPNHLAKLNKRLLWSEKSINETYEKLSAEIALAYKVTNEAVIKKMLFKSNNEEWPKRLNKLLGHFLKW